MRKRKSGEEGKALLPWRLPKPLSAEKQMWVDYRAFKAAGLLGTWFDMYRDMLNLKPPLPEPQP